MKTHQEIHDAIQQFQVPLASKQEWLAALEILHALNDRIVALEQLSEKRWNHLNDSLIEIHDR